MFAFPKMVMLQDFDNCRMGGLLFNDRVLYFFVLDQRKMRGSFSFLTCDKL